MNETKDNSKALLMLTSLFEELEANTTLTWKEKDESVIIAAIRGFLEVSNNFAVKISFDSGKLKRLDFYDDNGTGGNGGTDGKKPPTRRLYAFTLSIKAMERKRKMA